LIISVPKTEYMTINCNPLPLQVYGEAIIHVNNFRYLGSMMASSTSDLARRKALAWHAFWQMEHLWRNPSVSISTKVKIFHSSCVTILLYGCESWVITGDMEKKINSFATSCYRIMMNIKRLDRVSNATIYERSNTEPLINLARKRQLQFLGHILRMPEPEPSRRYALYIPSHGKRRPGRQKTTYLAYIQKMFGDTENMLDKDAIIETAMDRLRWRNFVVACLAAE